MPRSDPRYVLAALGCLVFIALPCGQGSANQSTRTQSEISNSLRSIASSLTEANEPQRESADCPQGADDRKSDLCAQWKAADAASDSAYWTEWTVWLGLIGLVLGAVTMGAAIAAAVFAKRAAVATEATVAIAQDAADGAQEALIIAERNAEAAQGLTATAQDSLRIANRAWMAPGAPFFTLNLNAPAPGKIISAIGFTFNWINRGNTPAVEVRMFTQRLDYCYQPELELPEIEDSDIVGPAGVLNPDVLYFDPVTWMQTRVSLPIVIECIVTYKDIFSDEVRWSRFKVHITYKGVADLRTCHPSVVTVHSFEVKMAGKNNIMT